MTGWLATTLFVLARVSGLILIVPGLSQNLVPWRARLLLIVLVSLPVLCVLVPSGDVASSSVPTIVLHEVMVGLSLGFVPAVIVFGLQVSVQALNGMTGLPGGEVTNSLATSSTMQRLMLTTALAVFFLSSGHRVVLHAVLDSFRWLPPGSYTSLEPVHEILIDLFAASFALGVRAMTPIAVSLAISLMCLALINRIVPQFGYFAVGMSVQGLVLLGSLFLCAGGVVWFLNHSFSTSSVSLQFPWQQALEQMKVP